MRSDDDVGLHHVAAVFGVLVFLALCLADWSFDTRYPTRTYVVYAERVFAVIGAVGLAVWAREYVGQVVAAVVLFVALGGAYGFASVFMSPGIAKARAELAAMEAEHAKMQPQLDWALGVAERVGRENAARARWNAIKAEAKKEYRELKAEARREFNDDMRKAGERHCSDTGNLIGMEDQMSCRRRWGDY